MDDWIAASQSTTIYHTSVCMPNAYGSRLMVNVYNYEND